MDTLDKEHKHFQKWLSFHRENPHVYGEIVALAREAIRSGYSRWGMQGIFEIRRWENRYKNPVDVDGYKMNDHYRSFYSRCVMENEPDLVEFFEIRESRSMAL
jgi:hypothetical protein